MGAVVEQSMEGQIWKTTITGGGGDDPDAVNGWRADEDEEKQRRQQRDGLRSSNAPGDFRCQMQWASSD
jgi:hypothetical protein